MTWFCNLNTCSVERSPVKGLCCIEFNALGLGQKGEGEKGGGEAMERGCVYGT
jgi:hypothetical protein